MTKKILIIGDGDISGVLIHSIINKHKLSPVLIANERQESYEINGIKYRKKQPKEKNDFTPRLHVNEYFNHDRKQKKRPDVDIFKEYGLILQKKSNLSRSDRGWVVREFDKAFEIIN